jgi:hypothetical protein
MHPTGSSGASYLDSAASEDSCAIKTALSASLWFGNCRSRIAEYGRFLPLTNSSYKWSILLKTVDLPKLPDH